LPETSPFGPGALAFCSDVEDMDGGAGLTLEKKEAARKENFHGRPHKQFEMGVGSRKINPQW
jgi:hypothetical protein